MHEAIMLYSDYDNKNIQMKHKGLVPPFSVVQ